MTTDPSVLVIAAQIKLAAAVAASAQKYADELRQVIEAINDKASAKPEATQLNLSPKLHFDGVQLAELLVTLPISRSSLFELLKALGVTTHKAPGVDGKGRVAWLTRDEADRVRNAALDVAAGRAQIAEFDQRPPGKISRGKLLCVISELLPNYAQNLETYRVSELRRYCEPRLSSLLGKEDLEKDCDNRPKWHGRFDYAHKEAASHLGFLVSSNGVYRTT